MASMRRFFTWIDTNALFVASVFLLAFIPLFPKIPLFDALPGYIVRVRIEDILVFFTMVFWVRELWLGRVKLHSLYIWGIFSYGVVGLLSLLFGIFLLETIPLELLHIGKSVLHYFRYIEYFLLFIIAYSSIRSRKQSSIVLWVLSLTVLAVALYGYGQQHWQLPLYSTMNREYSKGVALYIQEFARPQSTFAGPYDLGAFLAFTLPLLFSVSFLWFLNKKTRFQPLSILMGLAQVSGLWMLIASGAKTALASYAVGIGVIIFLKLSGQRSLHKKVIWGGGALVAFFFLLIAVIQFSGPTTRDYLRDISNQNRITRKTFSVLSFEENPAPAQAPDDRPTDLYGAGHEVKRVATESASGVETYIDVPTKSTWSENALKYGISMGIRLDTLWPNAIKGYFTNPLTGKGYGTLSKTESQQFTEADSTDNNYLRVLGETGLFGFLTFFGIILLLLRNVYLKRNSDDQLVVALSTGLFAATIALLVNAVYIDVFAASKVAFTFWAVTGFVIATIQDDADKAKKSKKSQSMFKLDSSLFSSSFEKNTFNSIKKHLKNHYSLYLSLIVLFFIMHQNPFAENTLLKNIGETAASVEQIVAARCYLEGKGMSVCNLESGTVLKQRPSLYNFLLLPFMAISDTPTVFYFANATILIISVLMAYFVLRMSLQRWQKNPSLRMLLGLGSTLLLIAFLANTQQPFHSGQVAIFLLIVPIVSSLIATSTHTLSSKTSSAVRNGFGAFLILFLLLSSPLSTLTTRFQNDQIPLKYKAVERMNLSLDENFVAQHQLKPFVISTLNPYYIDLFSNRLYASLPLTPFQNYFDSAPATWGENDYSNLSTLYSNILQSGHRLFVSDYGLDNDPANQASFDAIANEYRLQFYAIDCEERCNLYSVSPEVDPVSPVPMSINSYPLDLNQLITAEHGYSFRIFSNQFNPDIQDVLHSTKLYAQRVAEVSKDPTGFSIATGDVGTRGDGGQWEYFIQLTALTHQFPLLYSPGNFDLIPKKYPDTSTQTFYTEKDFFILAPIREDSTINPLDQLDIYNALLRLEKMPDIENVFIIAHDLDWQNAPTAQNFVERLENRIARISDKNVYIFTNDHSAPSEDDVRSYAQSSPADAPFIEYHASRINGTTTDTYLDIFVSDRGDVSVLPKSLPLHKEQLMFLNQELESALQ